MKLSVFERLNLLGILPTEGSFMNLKLVRVMREDLSFSEKEHKLLNFVNTDDGRITWATNVVGDKTINIGEIVKQLIKKELKKLDKAEKLKEEHYSLFIKFVGDNEKEKE